MRRAFVELHGPLGAGKTTFVRHLLRAFGVQGRIKSPTYAIMEPYELAFDADHAGLEGHSPAWHFDFYRFDDPREWEDAGFREIFAAEGMKLAEWPEHAQGLLPEPDLRLWIEPEAAGDSEAQDPLAEPAPRRVRLEACTPLGLELLP
jgi:tRNA threonylcarbamoyladenosine biosynthesis protein TsaE